MALLVFLKVHNPAGIYNPEGWQLHGSKVPDVSNWLAHPET